MPAVSLSLPEDLKARLAKLSERTGRSESDTMIDAIQEHVGDMEALDIAEQRLIEHRAGRSQSYTQKEMEDRYGLAD
jgi:RHH-type rel operon transcriptional repressor/antitoxin RelB